MEVFPRKPQIYTNFMEALYKTYLTNKQIYIEPISDKPKSEPFTMNRPCSLLTGLKHATCNQPESFRAMSSYCSRMFTYCRHFLQHAKCNLQWPHDVMVIASRISIGAKMWHFATIKHYCWWTELDFMGYICLHEASVSRCVKNLWKNYFLLIWGIHGISRKLVNYT